MVALKTFLYTQMDPALRRMTLGLAEEIKASGEQPTLQQLRKRLEDKQLYQNWISTRRRGGDDVADGRRLRRPPAR